MWWYKWLLWDKFPLKISFLCFFSSFLSFRLTCVADVQCSLLCLAIRKFENDSRSSFIVSAIVALINFAYFSCLEKETQISFTADRKHLCEIVSLNFWCAQIDLCCVSSIALLFIHNDIATSITFKCHVSDALQKQFSK